MNVKKDDKITEEFNDCLIELVRLHELESKSKNIGVTWEVVGDSFNKVSGTQMITEIHVHTVLF